MPFWPNLIVKFYYCLNVYMLTVYWTCELPFDFLQMVSVMDQVHTGLGGVQFLLHAPGIWLLQRAPKKTLLPGYSWTNCIPYRHCCEIFRGIPWPRHVSNRLQSHCYCPPVLQIKLHFWSSWLLPMGCYLQGYSLAKENIELKFWIGVYSVIYFSFFCYDQFSHAEFHNRLVEVKKK